MTGPFDKARLGRLVHALLNGDIPTANSVVDEATRVDRVLELLDAAVGTLIAQLRVAYGDDLAKQLAADWILKAHMDMESAQPSGNSDTE